MKDIRTALFQAELLYGIEIDEDTFEEIALIVHKRIGNKNTRLFHFTAHIDPHTLTIELPCNCDLLEAVLYDWEDWDYTSNHNVNGNYSSHFIEQYIESRKHFTDPLYHRGKYAEYWKSGNTLQFKHNHGHVHIIYKGELLDDTGMPYVNDKEIDAIAAWVAYSITYREGLKTKNAAIILFALDLEKKAKILIDLARTPEYINLNDMDEILEVKTSWNRKVHNKSFKPLI